MTAPSAVIFGCLGTALSPREAAFYRDVDPWGFILFARNVESPDQLRRLTGALRDSVGRDAPVLVDQEGGRVARLRGPHWTEWEDPLPFLDALPPAARAGALRLRYRLIAAELRAVGIDVNCAPMVDIAQPDTHAIVRTRTYGTDARTVAALGRAVADGLSYGGCLPVLKHIPGHGRTPLDSHKDLPVVTASRALLEAEDFLPFRALADLPMGMMAHIIYSALDPDLPASTSARVERVVREELGFDGLLMCDDLSMQALSGTMSDRAAAVIAAGYDLVLHCNGEMPDMEAVAAEVPRLAGASLPRIARVEALRAARPVPPVPDPADTRALIASLAKKEATHA